jgi:hypothetical protein
VLHSLNGRICLPLQRLGSIRLHFSVSKSSSEVSDLLEASQQNPFDFGRYTGRIGDGILEQLLRAWKVHQYKSEWEDCIKQLIRLARTEDHFMLIAKTIIRGSRICEKAKKTPAFLACCLQAIAGCPTACHSVVRSLFRDRAVDNIWGPLKSALFYRNSIHEDLLIDRESNAAIAEFVWRRFTAAAGSVETYARHVKYALECFYEVPAFVSKLVAGTAGLPFKTALSHTKLRDTITIKVNEFKSQKRK